MESSHEQRAMQCKSAMQKNRSESYPVFRWAACSLKEHEPSCHEPFGWLIAGHESSPMIFMFVHLPSQTCGCRHLLSNQSEGKQGSGQQERNIFFPKVNACQRISSMLGSNHSRSIGADWWPAMTQLSHLLGAGTYRGALVSLLLLLDNFFCCYVINLGWGLVGWVGAMTPLRLQNQSDATSENPPY